MGLCRASNPTLFFILPMNSCVDARWRPWAVVRTRRLRCIDPPCIEYASRRVEASAQEERTRNRRGGHGHGMERNEAKGNKRLKSKPLPLVRVDEILTPTSAAFAFAFDFREGPSKPLPIGSDPNHDEARFTANSSFPLV